MPTSPSRSSASTGTTAALASTGTTAALASAGRDADDWNAAKRDGLIRPVVKA
jgi:hypothetical protein